MTDSARGLARSIGRTLNGTVAVRAAKNLRNAIVDHGFRRCGREAGRQLAAALADRGCRDTVFTIAFNSPWVIDLLTRAWARHQPDIPLVVVDNSSDRAARSSHAELCRRRGVPWLPLPWNPEWNPNRSHGIALNWVWFNVIRHADLEFTGFVDHDCIPIAACDLRRRMQGHDAHGLRHDSATLPGAWSLWPGYCFLRPGAAGGHLVDFKHRIEDGLDTGGGNWRGWYRHLDPGRVTAATCAWVRPDFGAGEPAAACPLLDGAFLHLEGASYRGTFRDPELRRQFAEALVERPFACVPAEPPVAA